MPMSIGEIPKWKPELYKSFECRYQRHCHASRNHRKIILHCGNRDAHCYTHYLCVECAWVLARTDHNFKIDDILINSKFSAPLTKLFKRVVTRFGKTSPNHVSQQRQLNKLNDQPLLIGSNNNSNDDQDIEISKSELHTRIEAAQDIAFGIISIRTLISYALTSWFFYYSIKNVWYSHPDEYKWLSKSNWYLRDCLLFIGLGAILTGVNIVLLIIVRFVCCKDSKCKRICSLIMKWSMSITAVTMTWGIWMIWGDIQFFWNFNWWTKAAVILNGFGIGLVLWGFFAAICICGNAVGQYTRLNVNDR